MRLLKWLFGNKKNAGDDSTSMSTHKPSVEHTAQVVPPSAVPEKYRSVFQEMMSDETLGSGTERFKSEVNSNPVAILTAFLDWNEEEFDFSHNDFIFAIYDRWTPISAQCVWRAHMRSKWSFTSGGELSILGRVLSEATSKGDHSVLEDIKKATPAGQESHLREILNMVST